MNVKSLLSIFYLTFKTIFSYKLMSYYSYNDFEEMENMFKNKKNTLKYIFFILLIISYIVLKKIDYISF